MKPLIKRPGTPRHIRLDDIHGDQEFLNVGDNITALVETFLSIACSVSGTPKPSVTWTKDGQSLDGDGIWIEVNGSLVIGSAQPSDAGRYTCTATNPAGEDTVSTNVEVAGKMLSLTVNDNPMLLEPIYTNPG